MSHLFLCYKLYGKSQIVLNKKEDRISMNVKKQTRHDQLSSLKVCNI